MTTRILYSVRFTNSAGLHDSIIWHRKDAATHYAEKRNGTVHEFLDVEPEDRSPLSPAQRRFLADFAREGYSVAPNYGTGASAWHRTCNSLVARGLVKKHQHCACLLTARGLAVTLDVLNERS